MSNLVIRPGAGGVTPDEVNQIINSLKGIANGIASLDGTAKVPVEQLPVSFVDLKGVWDAATNTPTLASGVGTNGDMYYVNVAGSTNLDGITDWKVGDFALFVGGAENRWYQIDNELSQAEVLNFVEKVNLATGYTLAGGTSTKTLTVSEDSTIDQNLATTASPTHADLTLTNQQNHTLLSSNGSGQIIGATLTDANVFIGDVSNDPVSRTISGDATLSNTGVLTVNQASDTVAGKVELATSAETVTGTDTTKATTPAGVKAAIDPLFSFNRQIYWDGTDNPNSSVWSVAGTLGGTAAYNATDDYVRLTPDAGGQSGTLHWVKEQGSRLKIIFEFRTARPNPSADAVYLFINSTSLPDNEDSSTGGYLLAFDEWQNEVQLQYDGSSVATLSLSGSVWADDIWHRAEFEINYNNISVALDGTIILEHKDINGRNVSGNLIGIGARNGGAGNLHDVRRVEVYTDDTGIYQNANFDKIYAPKPFEDDHIISKLVDTPFGGIGHYENMLTWSEALDNSNWVKQSNVTATYNNDTAPNGENTADTVEWTSAGLGIRQSSIGVSNGQTYTFSVWGKIKAGTNNEISIDIGDGAAKSIFLTSKMERHFVTLTAGSSDWIDITHNETSTFAFWGWQLSEGSDKNVYVQTGGISTSDNQGCAINGKLNIQDGGIVIDAIPTGATRSIIFSEETNSQVLTIEYAASASENNKIFGDKPILVDTLVRNSTTFSSSTNTNALQNPSIIRCTDTSSARTLTVSSSTIQLGKFSEVFEFIVKDESGGAGTNNITIDTEGSETIDGATSVVISVNYGAVRLYSDGSNLFTV
ncbi:phage head spike fiber domain-containing protein [Fangia hongkongensis]|uniref:phage head spike fiber domain-containing protein n=1 Tax=Fangia hongkongensis TaxID=270495 RepID=UPI000377719C|nr:hypothetical protein [Fangia hongkongensis]MBK2124816.1 hypothetical protein [Fangia hongkongensis]